MPAPDEANPRSRRSSLRVGTTHRARSQSGLGRTRGVVQPEPAPGSRVTVLMIFRGFLSGLKEGGLGCSPST